LTGRLGQLGDLLAEANRQIAAYLVRRESQAAAASTEETRDALKQQIAALSEKIDQLAAGAPAKGDASSGPRGPALQHALQDLLKPLAEKLDRVEASLKTSSAAAPPEEADRGPSNASILEAVRQLQGRLDGRLEQLADLVRPQQEPADAAPTATSAEWERAIAGADLAAMPALAFQRRQLIQGVLEGDAGACALAGQLLVFQSAPAERLPQLLKDIGEAFYRWQPKTTPGTNPVEEALVAWLQKRCETAGIYNTITLVHPGERFDAARHTASSRGVEIRQVHGWIVLRDNGKVYTKATVSVR
jgi:hypothetical protein